MTAIKNILFIMADQLRWDYLSCYGHPHLNAPNIDKLTARKNRVTVTDDGVRGMREGKNSAGIIIGKWGP